MTTLVKKRLPGRPKDEALQERRRQEILDVAAAMFARHGFSATDVQWIADRLKVSKGTVYRYFPSKENLFLSAVERGIVRLNEHVDQARGGETDRIDEIRAAVKAYLQFFKSNPELVELFVQERAEFRQRRRPIYFQNRDVRRGPWREYFAKLMDEGRMRRMSVDRIMDVLGDVLYGTMLTNHFTGRSKPHESQAQDVLDVFFNGVLTERGRNGGIAINSREKIMTTDEAGVETIQPLSEHDTGETYVTPGASAAVMPPHPPRRAGQWKRWAVVSIAAVIVVLGLVIGVPKAIYAWNHTSTDDAIVNGHVTYISSRVSGLAQEVLVDDNQFVEAGTPMIRIDRVPYQLAVDQHAAELARAKLAVAQEIAGLNLAEAQLASVRAQVRSKIADLRGSWYLVASVLDFVKYEEAALQANVAKLRQDEASLGLAQKEYDRVMKLGAGSVSEEDIDQRRSALEVAEAQVNSSQADVQQTRALLGLPPDLKNPSTVPENVGQTFNGTQYALSTFLGSFAQLGLNIDLLTLPSLADMKQRFTALDIQYVIENSPSVKAAKAQVASAQAALGGDKFDPAHPDLQPEIVQAQKALDQAQLQLGYTEIVAPLSGYVNRRSVNPGTLVTVGQPLLTIWPLSDVWIDANFKETQLADLRIGQKVDIYVDAYPDKVFHGRVAGFSPGTGAVTSLLPPENATGNFVKVVQRLPVRIELTEPNPEDTPLFAGLSVDPEVDIRSQPQGPDAGRRLLTAAPSLAGAQAP